MELDFKLKPPMVGALLFATPIVNYTSFQPAALERPKWADSLGNPPINHRSEK